MDVRLGEVRTIQGNPVELQEMLTNLIFNAVDAMPQGGRLTIRTWMEREQAVLQVSDTGVGMSDEIKAHLFEPFFTTKGTRGTGLGLSIVYGAVQRHNGRINVESQVGKGTTVTIWLPVSQAPERVAEGKPKPSAPASLRILCVDDEPDVRQTVVRMLEADGHQVEEAASGQEAIARLNEISFDLLITDLGMPEVSGREVIAAARKRWPRMPIVLLSGWGDWLSGEEKPDADVSLSKPITTGDLQQALIQAIKAKREDVKGVHHDF